MELPRIAYKKIIFLTIFLFFLLVVIFIRAETASAQNESSLERFQQSLVECGETGNTSLECFTGGAETLTTGATSGVIPNTLNTVSTMILGPVEQVSEQATNQGAIADIGNLMANLYNSPPASSTEYLADLGRSLGILPKTAYAQGETGFTGLKPILKLWKMMRNIAYLFFVIIFVFVGFAIMFRIKIDPQTVISIQNALPKLVIALLLVTFSYAIAGFLIDLMYIFIALLFSLFKGDLANISNIHTLEELLKHNVFTAAWNLLGEGGSFTTVATGVKDIVQGLVSIPIVTTALGTTAQAITIAILAIAIAFSMVKLFFLLLISYVSIIVGVIFSPLILMLEAVPGQKGLGNWIKMMLSNIIVFPLTAAIFILASILTQGYKTAAPTEIGWVAPFLGTGYGPEVVSTLIGMGMILLTPSIVESVKKAIGAPGLAGMAAGVMQPIGAAGGVMMAPIKSVTSPIIDASQKAKGEEMAKRLHLPGHDRIRE